MSWEFKAAEGTKRRGGSGKRKRSVGLSKKRETSTPRGTSTAAREIDHSSIVKGQRRTMHKSANGKGNGAWT